MRDLENKSRRPKVLASEIKKFGQVGIGSAWNGIEGTGGIGGGEGFLFDDQNFRITKGNEVIKAREDEQYWNFQIADFSGAKKISTLRDQKIFGRKNLAETLLYESQGKRFVVTFDVEFVGEFFARSNGVFLEDKVSESTKSLQQKFSADAALSVDFTVLARSEILLKTIDEIILKAD